MLNSAFSTTEHHSESQVVVGSSPPVSRVQDGVRVSVGADTNDLGLARKGDG